MHRISSRPWVNGSSASRLIDQMMIVHRALEDAAHAMRIYQPHGRDYQLKIMRSISGGCGWSKNWPSSMSRKPMRSADRRWRHERCDIQRVG